MIDTKYSFQRSYDLPLGGRAVVHGHNRKRTAYAIYFNLSTDPVRNQWGGAEPNIDGLIMQHDPVWGGE